MCQFAGGEVDFSTSELCKSLGVCGGFRWKSGRKNFAGATPESLLVTEGIMVQLWYGLYTKMYDTLWGDWGAGMRQRTGKGGADDT